jgi:peroxiredoxin
MKNIFIILAIVFIFSSCQKESNEYLISAIIDGVPDGKKVTLRTFKDGKPLEVQTTFVKSGKFSMNGSIKNPDIHLLQVEGTKGALPFILENNKLDITMYKDSLDVSLIRGSEENVIANKYMGAVRKFKMESDELRKKYSEAQQKRDTLFLKEYIAKNQELRNRNNKHNIEFIKANSGKLFAVLILENLLNNNAIKINETNNLFSSLAKDVQKSVAGIRIKKLINLRMATEIGAIAPDFTAPDPDGKQISLNEIKGKVTIIDFWAAWCGPCRKENPNVVKLYEKYHDKGLEIIGVSLDGNSRQKDPKKAWLDAIEKDGLKWHQVSNLNYFRGPVAKQYNIQAIPATFILDSEGKIIAKNPRGPALEQKISELLN